MNTIKQFPSLFSQKPNGTIQWDISVCEENNNIYIVIEHGYMYGARQHNQIPVIIGKNLDKRNFTTPQEQAIKEAESRWIKKSKTYFETLNESSNNNLSYISPMLALKYKQRSHDIQFPCIVQAKLDGVRCISQKQNNSIIAKIQYTSRTGQEFKTLNHLDHSVIDIIDYCKTPIDGEIYTHDIDFENIVSAVRRNKNLNQLNDKLQYWIYDLIDVNTKCSERIYKILKFFNRYGTRDNILQTLYYQNLYLCPTFVCNSENQLTQFHKYFNNRGYEGSIIRNVNGLYKMGPSRSKNLQKLKDFVTDEFEIIDIVDGIGTNECLAIFVCKTKDGHKFNVTPEMSHMRRNEIFLNKQQYIGKYLTVKFQSYSRYGKPKFATGIEIRDYE